MKKILFLLLTLLLLLTVAACGSDTGSNVSSQPDGMSAPPAGTSGTETSSHFESDIDGSKVLVAYFSATGKTEAVAGYIADAVSGDMFAIVPAESYTSADLDWNDTNSRVSQEHDDPALRQMELTVATVDEWDSYDTVFIGYPIWWGIAAWPVDNFITANDFTGKTVIPFCTSSSSSFGESGKLLAELAGNGDWQEGQRFQSNASVDEVVEWVNSLERFN